MLFNWLTNNSIELFGAITGIVYVVLEVRQKTWLWPVGIITSAVYIWVFFTGKLYADMSLQVYYVVISALGWYWWARGREQGAESREQVKAGAGQGAAGSELRAEGSGQGAGSGDSPLEGGQGDVKNQKSNTLQVTHIKPRLVIELVIILIVLYTGIYLALSKLTDSPVPGWDAFVTSLSIIGTWMLARKIYEHWYLWILVNSVTMMLCLMRELYPTVALYAVYLVMSFIGLYQWKKSIS